MTASRTTDLAPAVAGIIEEAFHAYFSEFERITCRSAGHFARGDWSANQRDVLTRLELYPRQAHAAAARVEALIGDPPAPRVLWSRIKQAYLARIAGESNFELAETFYNSITRILFSTIGVDPRIEFVSPELLPRTREVDSAISRRYDEGPLQRMFHRLLGDYGPLVPGDRAAIAARLEAEATRHFNSLLGSAAVQYIEMLREPFYRDNAAYLVGRLACCNEIFPVILALRRQAGHTRVDAVLLAGDEVSILFSFTRAYFHVVSACPRELVIFLKSIMPWKKTAELYTSIGFNRHGKTELYADLQRTLHDSDERFRVAPGDHGLVMAVFDLPSYDRVFKVIRDRFRPPKSTTREQVLDRYRLVFRRDRVGRLIDAQQFEHLSFDRERFEEPLLRELCAEASRTVSVDAERVVIRHLYVERKVTPLNLFLREAEEDAAVRAVVDYGNAIRELAAANIFPGDFLLKNFGVTRHGRVVFYDYDELCLLEDCNFRALPPARSPEEELDAEVWFRVGPHDVFPEEFRRFLGLLGQRRAIFERHHEELFDPEYWRAIQEAIAADEPMEFYPYRRERRLNAGP